MTIKKVEELLGNEKLMLINARLFINSVSIDNSIADIDLILQVSKLNTAIEILMHFIVSVKNINISINSGFQKLRSKLQKLMDNNQLSEFALSKLEPINHARNGGLHRGFAPQAKYIKEWVQVTKEFYDFVCIEMFGNVIEFTMISLISQEYWRQKFIEIEEKYRERQYLKFLELCSNLLDDIQSFLIILNLRDIIYNKCVLDTDQLVNYEESTFRFNALNFGIKFTDFKEVKLTCDLLSTMLGISEDGGKTLPTPDGNMDFDDYLKRHHPIISLQTAADMIYYKIWNYLVGTGISDINPFELGHPVELLVDDKKIVTELLPLVINRPKQIQLFIGYLKDIGFVQNLEKKSVHLNWIGFGKTTKPIPITKVSYHYLTSRDFMIFILESEGWDYLRPKKQKTLENDSIKVENQED